MLRIHRDHSGKWELLLKVLSEEMQEDDPVFRLWLEEDIEHEKLYLLLRGEKQIESELFDKNKVFDNISDMLCLNVNNRIHFYQRIWFRYAMLFVAVVTLGLSGYIILSDNHNPEQTAFVETRNSVFDPGSKKAYLLSSRGELVDLSESFDIEKEDGTVISNRSEGVIRFKKNKSEKKEIGYHTIYVPKGGEYELLLSDGSKVYLNSETRLVFPSGFEGDTRRVELTGEAYFEVKKDSKPFIVETTGLKIEVLGTSFNVNAYPDNPSLNATLVEGNIRLSLPDHPETYLLRPEENLNMNKMSGELFVRVVDTDIYTAWVKGKFVFRNQSLEDIFSQLKRWYDFVIVYENQDIKAMRFTGSAEKAKPLDYLLNQIQSVTDVKYKNEGDKIILY